MRALAWVMNILSSTYQSHGNSAKMKIMIHYFWEVKKIWISNKLLSDFNFTVKWDAYSLTAKENVALKVSSQNQENQHHLRIHITLH